MLITLYRRRLYNIYNETSFVHAAALICERIEQ